MPKGIKGVARDWPLDERERQLVALAFEMTRPAMRGYRARYPELADEIDGNFDFRVCLSIHNFDPAKVEFRAWVFATLGYSLKRSIHRSTWGRSKDFRDGSRAFVAISFDQSEIPAAHPEPVSPYTCSLDPRSARAVEMHCDGFGTRAIGREIGLSGNRTSVILRRSFATIRESIERASA